MSGFVKSCKFGGVFCVVKLGEVCEQVFVDVLVEWLRGLDLVVGRRVEGKSLVDNL